MGDGTVNVGLGMLNTTAAFRRPTTGTCCAAGWAASRTSPSLDYDGPVRGAALPMGFNRTPHYRDGLLLVGDAAGAVNPFNGEGIAYAMETGEVAAEVVAQALAGPKGRAGSRRWRRTRGP